MRKFCFLFLLSIGLANAQALSFGLTGGVPVTNPVSGGLYSIGNVQPTSSNYTVGPTIQVNLPFQFRVEVDALYRPYSFSAACGVGCAASGGLVAGTYNVSGSQWSFPILAQYRFRFPVLKPFVEAGPAFERFTGFSSNHTGSVPPGDNQIPAGQAGHFENSSDTAFVMGAGVDFRILGRTRLSGEFRYIREGASYFQAVSNLNQVEFLLGIHF